MSGRRIVELAIAFLVLVELSFSPVGSSAAEESHQPTVRSIRIEGNQAFTKRKVLGWMDTKRGQAFCQETLEQDVVGILEHYRRYGYMLAEAGVPDLAFSKDSSRVDIGLEITEGPLLRVGKIGISGNGFLDTERILAMFDTRANKPFREWELERDIESLLTVYENNGYPYCQVYLSDFRIGEEQNLNFDLHIEEGPLVIIDGIEVEGNELTKDYVITRELRLEPGDVCRQRKVDQAQKRLERLGLFDRVYPPRLEHRGREDRATLIVGVEEGKPNAMNGVLGYNPAPEGGDGYLTGLIDLSFLNLFGTGRRLDAHWSRMDPYSSKLKFGYWEPWLFGVPLDLGLELEQVDQDTTYVLTRAAATLRMPLADCLAGNLGLGWERVIPDPRGGLALARSRKLTGTIGFEFDSRDDRLNPSRGVFYRASAEYGIKRNRATAHYTPPKKRVESSKFTLDLEHFVPTFRKQVLAIGLHGGQIRSQEEVVPISEQFRLGGANSLRGYREDQFTGSRIAWSNLEYRFLLSKRSRAFLFLDLGHYSRKTQSSVTGEIERLSGKKVGYGLGLRLDSRLGIVGIDYGLGQGDSPMEGKVHFGVRNEF